MTNQLHLRKSKKDTSLSLCKAKEFLHLCQTEYSMSMTEVKKVEEDLLLSKLKLDKVIRLRGESLREMEMDLTNLNITRFNYQLDKVNLYKARMLFYQSQSHKKDKKNLENKWHKSDEYIKLMKLFLFHEEGLKLTKKKWNDSYKKYTDLDNIEKISKIVYNELGTKLRRANTKKDKDELSAVLADKEVAEAKSILKVSSVS
jgi:hypothetical protein